jgi:hypothetical protein
MHEHSFTLNLAHQTLELSCFTSHLLATGHQFAQRKTATRWLGRLLRKLSTNTPSMLIENQHRTADSILHLFCTTFVYALGS